MNKEALHKLAAESLNEGLRLDDWDKIGCVNHDCDKCKAQQEPVAMRMPKVGDEVVCIEDDSLGTVAYLTAGGSPEIRFDDGSHGTYLLPEFAELFRYAQPLTQQELVAMYRNKCSDGSRCLHGCHANEPCYTTPQAQPAQQEPVTWGVDWGKAGDIPCVSIIKRLPDGGIEVMACEYAPYSYTTPQAQPAREWVGLTKEDKAEIVAATERDDRGYVMALVEAKLMEKNT